MRHSFRNEVEDLKIEYGKTVVDINDNRLGAVDHIIRDTWSGEIKKFIVRRKALGSDLFISPEDVSEIYEDRIKLNLKFDTLTQQEG